MFLVSPGDTEQRQTRLKPSNAEKTNLFSHFSSTQMVNIRLQLLLGHISVREKEKKRSEKIEAVKR